jgi:hypothetical protein
MKRLVIALLCILMLAACNGNEKVTEADAGAEITPEAKGTVVEDGFIKYRSAEWSGELNGLKINVNSVSVTNDLAKVLEIDEAEPGVRAVFVWIMTDNPTDKTFFSTLGNATLVTSSREQASPDPFISSSFPLQIAPNAKTEGDLVYVLETDEDVENIDEITLTFEITDQQAMEKKQFNVKIPLTPKP